MSKYPNSGTLSRNKRKEKDTHADFVGQLNVLQPGEYWISAWVKEGRDGKFFSLSLKEKEPKAKPHEDDARTIERFKDTAERSFGSGLEVRERPSGLPERPRHSGAALDDEIPF